MANEQKIKKAEIELDRTEMAYKKAWEKYAKLINPLNRKSNG